MATLKITRLLGRIRKGLDLAIRPYLFARRNCILVLGHMRSRSTLLCHILGSHPEISGYAETHGSYTGRFSLLRLNYFVHLSTGRQPLKRYVLDKVLNNGHEVSPSFVQAHSIKCIVSIRSPENTIKSLMALRRNKSELLDPTTAAWSTNYYCSRLVKLVELSRDLPETTLIEAEKLIQEPETTLRLLESRLGLSSPLSTDYQVFPFTGKPVWGDPGERIRTGSLSSVPSDYGSIEIPPELLERAKETYLDCRQKLMATCS